MLEDVGVTADDEGNYFISGDVSSSLIDFTTRAEESDISCNGASVNPASFRKPPSCENKLDFL